MAHGNRTNNQGNNGNSSWNNNNRRNNGNNNNGNNGNGNHMNPRYQGRAENYNQQRPPQQHNDQNYYHQDQQQDFKYDQHLHQHRHDHHFHYPNNINPFQMLGMNHTNFDTKTVNIDDVRNLENRLSNLGQQLRMVLEHMANDNTVTRDCINNCAQWLHQNHPNSELALALRGDNPAPTSAQGANGNQGTNGNQESNVNQGSKDKQEADQEAERRRAMIEELETI